VAPLGRAERAWVITTADLRPACQRELPDIPAARVVGEPVGRNTAAAVALAGVLAERDDPRAVLAVYPSDHHVADWPAFRRLARAALRCAREEAALVTLGITPRSADTGFGYIETAARTASGVPVPVRRFVEKPSARRARAFLQGGRHLWNSGMFFFAVRTLREAFEAHAPGIWHALQPVAAAYGSRSFAARLREAYAELPSVPFDVAVMEKASDVKVLRADMGWSDIGHWAALGEFLGSRGGNSSLGRVLALDATGNIVMDRGGLTALLGVKDLIVVRTGDAVLVCQRDRAQDLREIVASLEDEGLTEYL